jgi:hypothetical protein
MSANNLDSLVKTLEPLIPPGLLINNDVLLTMTVLMAGALLVTTGEFKSLAAFSREGHSLYLQHQC